MTTIIDQDGNHTPIGNQAARVQIDFSSPTSVVLSTHGVDNFPRGTRKYRRWSLRDRRLHTGCHLDPRLHYAPERQRMRDRRLYRPAYLGRPRAEIACAFFDRERCSHYLRLLTPNKRTGGDQPCRALFIAVETLPREA